MYYRRWQREIDLALGLEEAIELNEDDKEQEIDPNNNAGEDLFCTNPYCKDFNKDFKFASRRRKHDQ